MAGVPYHYILRNLWVRKLTTVLTAGGMALVVFVFAAVLMLSEGLRATPIRISRSGPCKRRPAPTASRSGPGRARKC